MTYRVSLVWPLIGAGSIFLVMVALFLSSINPSSKQEYQQVVEAAAMSAAIEPQRSTKQHRKGVKKDIWFMKEGERLQFHISSDESELLFENQEVIEKMKGMSCILQEELFYLTPDGQEEAVPMQIVRYIEADNAVYHYQNDLLEAEDVKIFRYKLPGHHLVESFTEEPTMRAIAKSVEISVLSKELSFKAKKMRVILAQ